MAIIKSIPSKRIINGNAINTSEIAIVSESSYRVTGEYVIIVKGVLMCDLVLDSTKSDHVVVKAMTKVNVMPDTGRIDEEYDEIALDQFACVEFMFAGGNWWILSSDGLKQS
jgi:hypothetical protein